VNQELRHQQRLKLSNSLLQSLQGRKLKLTPILEQELVSTISAQELV